MSLAFLFYFSRYLSPIQRRLLLAFVIFAFSYICSSRVLGDIGDDFSTGYYPTYIEIYRGNLDYFTRFSAVEVGLPIFFYLLSKIIATLLSEQELMFSISLFQGIIFALWLEIYAIKYTVSNNHGAIEAFSLLVLSFLYPTILIRSFIASIFMLYAITESRIIGRLLFFSLSCLFHSSSIIFLPIFFLGKHKTFFWTLPILVLLIYSDAYKYLDFSPELNSILFNKFQSLKDVDFDFQFEGFGNFLVFSLLNIFLYFLKSIKKNTIPIFNSILYSSITYLILIPLSQGSLRSTFFVFQVAVGFLFYLLAAECSNLISFTFTIIFLYKIIWLFTNLSIT